MVGLREELGNFKDYHETFLENPEFYCFMCSLFLKFRAVGNLGKKLWGPMSHF